MLSYPNVILSTLTWNEHGCHYASSCCYSSCYCVCFCSFSAISLSEVYAEQNLVPRPKLSCEQAPGEDGKKNSASAKQKNERSDRGGTGQPPSPASFGLTGSLFSGYPK